MLARLQIELRTAQGDFIPYQKAAVLQSILMEQVGETYASLLHKSELHPYSQSVIRQNEKNIWNITTTNQEAFQHILLPLLDSEFRAFTMEDDGWEVSVAAKKLRQIAKNEFVEKYCFEGSQRYLKLSFITPTAFKQRGEYVNIPKLRLIYQSLMNKYDAASDTETVGSEELLEQLLTYSKVVQYHLRSCQYPIRGVRVPAFLGQITVRVDGPQAMVDFLHMLFRFGEYAGVGIKTAMGMGAVRAV
ncbi:CRISPR-associated endoribonuclease Cas6 [Lachnospiraceae bacterium 29-84]